MKSTVFNRIAQLSDVAKISQAIEQQKPVRRRRQEGYVPPTSAAQEFLCVLWAQVLHIDRVGIEDNFFEIGGNSLAGTQVMARVRQRFGVALPLVTLFQSPTIAGLSEAIAAAPSTASDPDGSALVPQPRNQELPLSFSQQRLWFLDQLEPGSPR